MEILTTLMAPVRRGSDDVPHSLDKEHKFSFVRKKGRRTGSYLLRKQSSTGAELNYPRMEKLILALVHAARRRGDETPKDFLIEVPLEDNKKEADEKADTKSTKMELSCEWKLFTDGVASSYSSSAGLMLIDPEGKEYTYALHFGFETINNEA
ncbi:hypothetical protein Tco_0950581 [Tanacetum coccineum]